MAQNPKYDNDMVNLGYLNKRLGQTEESINNNNNSILQLPKNYSTPPNPPYYKDSLLCYDNKIYRCNTTKLKGEFSWNDWTIVATDDTTISDFIKNTYELEKLEIQEQIDGKVQTYYQENDPAKEWATDLDKGRHVGDYWYNTTNDTQWRYNQITTGPTIKYGWGQVNIPKSVFDTIDTKKSIYTEKPTSYKKDDLWIIEDNLSDEDLPIGTDENPISKGDWVFSVADSETYDKTHWVKRDEDVPLSYLKQHYYTITEIDSNLEIIERNTESKITKATEEISLNVSQTYTTKEEHTSAINDFDEQIGTINQTITEQKETLSDLSVEVGEVSISVESVEKTTEELIVDVNGVKESIIPTATGTGSNIYVDDASDDPLIQLEIEGKSEQATRSGKNKFNKDLYTYEYVTQNSTSDVGGYKTIPIYVGKANTNYYVSTNFLNGYSPFEKSNLWVLITNVADYIDAWVGIGHRDCRPSDTQFYNNTITSDGNGYLYLRVNNNTSKAIYDELMANVETQIEEGTVKTSYEQYGVSPSPDYPSEIKSVGYENLLDLENVSVDWATWNDNFLKIVNSLNTGTYTLILNFIVDTISKEDNYNIFGAIFLNNVQNIDCRTSFSSIAIDEIYTVKKEFTITPEIKGQFTAAYLYGAGNDAVGSTATSTTQNCILTKGTQEHSYIPYGKYGIEVKTTGKNFLPIDNITSPYVSVNENGTYNIISGTTTSNIYASGKDFTLSAGTYTFSSTDLMQNGIQIYLYNITDNSYNIMLSQYADKKTFTINETKRFNIMFFIIPNISVVNQNNIGLQVEKGSVATEYEQYQERTSSIILNAPLRSLPNGVKDIAYIRNNKLYVDRKIGSVVLNGSEDWIISGTLTNTIRYSISSSYFPDCSQYNYTNHTMSNYLVYLADYEADTPHYYIEGVGTSNFFFIPKTTASTLAEFKTWLSTHNTQVDYQLAEPYTEDLGEIEMPSTFKGINHISTTDELEPTINIEYVRDTTLSNYVEGQINKVMTIEKRNYSELVIEDDNIKASVESVSSSVDGLNTTINRVEEITTDNSQVINVISTSSSFDLTTGEVREVTTTTGFTFNADGMTIDDGSGFKAQHRSNGTYYKDGDSIVGQYTKDGSKQKDLQLFGVYSYGMTDIDDTPMFVGQLYTNENGEQAFGHFYNGEG